MELSGAATAVNKLRAFGENSDQTRKSKSIALQVTSIIVMDSLQRATVFALGSVQLMLEGVGHGNQERQSRYILESRGTVDATIYFYIFNKS